MKEEILKWLFDAQEAAKAVQRFVDGRGSKDYLEDEMLRSAVERKLGIVGEALVRIRREDPEVLDKIRDSRSIVSFRNILVHNYDSLDHRIVWNVIEEDLESLLSDIRSLMGPEPPS